MFKVVAAMRETPWEETEHVLDGLFLGLLGQDRRWYEY
jgi:hypothetical protein